MRLCFTTSPVSGPPLYPASPPCIMRPEPVYDKKMLNHSVKIAGCTVIAQVTNFAPKISGNCASYTYIIFLPWFLPLCRENFNSCAFFHEIFSLICSSPRGYTWKFLSGAGVKLSRNHIFNANKKLFAQPWLRYFYSPQVSHFFLIPRAFERSVVLQAIRLLVLTHLGSTTPTELRISFSQIICLWSSSL